MQRPRVLVVDDNASILKLVTGLIDGEFEIVGTAGDGPSAVASAIQLRPDIIVLDLSLPTIGGFQVVEQLQAKKHIAPIVLLTTFEDAGLVKAARSAGVLGYVTKRRMQTDLLPALRCALAGRP